MGPVYTSRSLANIANCKEEVDNWNAQTAATKVNSSSVTQNCNSDNSSCTISLTVNDVHQNSRVAYTYQCLNPIYTLGSLQISKEVVVYVAIGIDLVIAAAILLFIFSEKLAEDKEVK